MQATSCSRACLEPSVIGKPTADWRCSLAQRGSGSRRRGCEVAQFSGQTNTPSPRPDRSEPQENANRTIAKPRRGDGTSAQRPCTLTSIDLPMKKLDEQDKTSSKCLRRDRAQWSRWIWFNGQGDKVAEERNEGIRYCRCRRKLVDML
jgi:hypothetical protein